MRISFVEAYNTELQEKMQDYYRKTSATKQLNNLITSLTTTFLTDEQELDYWKKYPEDEQKIAEICEMLDVKEPLTLNDIQNLCNDINNLIEKIKDKTKMGY